MIRLNIVVEGATEETFVRDVLAPYWGAKGIFATARSVETNRKKGCVFRGGGRNYEKVRRDVVNWINQDHDAYCTTMFDLYGLPANFPGKSSIGPIWPAYDRVRYLEDAFAGDIDSNRFIPYIQLHEFEALLFADIDKMRIFYLEDKTNAIQRLKNIVNAFGSPELINEGNETAPSKRIIKEIPEYKDNKVLIGPTVAKEIGLPILRERCVHFNEWINKIESLS
ncbi:MAG: DUF4276 family protein [Bacillota bacterium]